MADNEDQILTIDRVVPHVSTVPAIAGQQSRLFVRERVRGILLQEGGGNFREGRVVLMVHGGFWPSEIAFDLDHPILGGPTYSWMEALAVAGFDVFAMDMTGYGHSSRPMMDDPGNLSPEHQALLIPRNLAAVREPSYPYRLVTTESEADDIDCVVEEIRALRGVEKVILIGWSGGGMRVGTYALRHPEKVARLIILASSNYADDGSDKPPDNLPEPGYPILFQDRAAGEVRWAPNVHSPDQVAPGISDAIWHKSFLSDPIGASWGPGGLRAPSRTVWGWNARAAAALTAPVLVMVGEYDGLMSANQDLYEAIGAGDKVFLEIAGASHFAAWEKQRQVLHAASVEWLGQGTINGRKEGSFRADARSVIAPAA